MIDPDVWRILDAAFFDYTYYMIFVPSVSARRKLRHDWLLTLRSHKVKEADFLQEFDRKYPESIGRATTSHVIIDKR
jgi:hypothetical protein